MKRRIFTIFKIIAVLSVVVLVVFGGYCFVVASQVQLDTNNLNSTPCTLEIFDKNGENVHIYNYDTVVEYDKIPTHLINAFVAIEDKGFFEHNGIDGLRILKATIKNLLSLNLTKEGASTITQQLIKNTHLTNKKTIERKIQEIKLALELEKVYTKEQIMQSYLNVIYFGNGIYGVGDASYSLFGKNYTELTLDECATLAGIVKSPANYSPIKSRDNCLKRRNLILNEMLKEGFITEEQLNVAVNAPLVIKPVEKIGATFIDAVIDEACEVLGVTENELAYGGYKIYTAYDSFLQKEIENIAKSEQYIPLNNANKMVDACIVLADNKKGLITACYTNLKSVDIYRQPGSTLKPFVSYLPSMSDGKLHPASPVKDEKRAYGNYCPKNYSDSYVGWTNARYAIAKSLNTVAVDLMDKHGIEKSIEYAKRYGIRFDGRDYTLATALGGMTKGVTPIEQTSAYMTLANGGYYKKCSFIEYITTKNGEIIKNIAPNGMQVESEEVSYLMTDMLYGVVKNGTASILNNPKYKVASKTGTVQNATDSNYNNDLWNLSYTSKNTLCVWLGNASNSIDTALSNGYTAGVYPTRIAKAIYDKIYFDDEPSDIPIPKEVAVLPYSKSAYDIDHTLVLANEFFTKEEIYEDIFNTKTLPSISNREDISVDLSSFSVSVDKNTPKIIIDTIKGVNYTVLRASLLSDGWQSVVEIYGDGKTHEFVDNVYCGQDYIYKIEAFVINYAGDKIYIESSDEYIVSIGYELW